MKNTIKTLIILIISALIIQPANGQRLLRKLQDKANQKLEEAAERKIDEVIDKKIDEALDSIDGQSSSEYEANKAKRDAEREARMARILTGMGMSGEPVPFEDSYSYEHLIEMHLESYDNSGKELSNGEFIIHLNPNSKSMAYEIVSGNMTQAGQGMFIIDAENGALLLLTDENGEKKGVAYGIGTFFESMGTAYNNEDIDLSETPETYLANPNVKKTGRTRTIAGLKCEEYTYNDENTDSEIWITRDLKMNTQDFFSTLFQTSMYTHGMGWGYVMAATSLDKDNGEKSIMEVTRVDKNSNAKFSMSDYEITNLGTFTIPTEEEDVEKK